MKKKFVVTRNSFHQFFGLNAEQLSEIKGGLLGDDPYLPTMGGGVPVDEEPTHNFECEEGYRWDDTLGMCVKI
jgi:hypothetical protein